MPHSQNQSELEKLAGVIAALHTPRFTTSLAALLQEVLPFDCAVVLGHRPNKHPIYLYDSIQDRRELLFQQYLTHAYLEDPFYLELIDNEQQGVFSYKDIERNHRPIGEYRSAFYQQTGWQDELCLTVKLDAGRWVVIYLGSLNERQAFSDDTVDPLRARFEVIASLCRHHWATQPFHLAEPSSDKSQVGNALVHAVATFGAARLSRREQQVTSLLLQGLDSEEIAETLKIGLGTVKNHRKRIYAQLRVKSLGELFRLFLNHAIASPISE